MNQRQKLVQKQFLNNEQVVIKRLEQVYGVALKDIDGKIEKLMKRFDPETGDLPQSAIYQIQYQKMLKGQIEGILNQMQTNQFLTVSDYLSGCYEDGFIGSLFDLHGQGVPLAMPLDQTKMVRAVQLDSKISQGLYTRLGEDVGLLKMKIIAQVSRSISNGTSFAQTAKQLAGYTRIGYNKAVRIARTEGHRIQTAATMDTMHNAKERGADVVKQWVEPVKVMWPWMVKSVNWMNPSAMVWTIPVILPVVPLKLSTAGVQYYNGHGGRWVTVSPSGTTSLVNLKPLTVLNPMVNSRRDSSVRETRTIWSMSSVWKSNMAPRTSAKCWIRCLTVNTSIIPSYWSTIRCIIRV